MSLTHWEGEPVRVLEALWGVPLLEAWATLGSTNDRLATLARENVPVFTTVVADRQTEGRGRKGRSWSAPTGKGLLISVLLRPPGTPARLLAPLLAGLAVCRAVEGVVPDLELRLAWPNDVLAGGRKLCGVLCEAVARGKVVAGIGLNVLQEAGDFPPEIRDSATSLLMVTGKEASRAVLAHRLVGELRTLFDPPTVRLEGDLAVEVERRDALRGRRVETSGATVGTARGIDPTGALLLETEEGVVLRVVAGSVRGVDEVSAEERLS